MFAHVGPGISRIAQYAALCEYGYFDRAEIPKLKSFGAMLQGHPDRNKTPGIEVNTGSLGQGLSICNGMALAAKLDGKTPGSTVSSVTRNWQRVRSSGSATPHPWSA